MTTSDGMLLIPDVKLALRIKSTAYDAEILQLIDTSLSDLRASGVEVLDLSDPLVKRAVILYCKGSFGYDVAPHYKQDYENMKRLMTLAGEYKA